VSIRAFLQAPSACLEGSAWACPEQNQSPSLLPWPVTTIRAAGGKSFQSRCIHSPSGHHQPAQTQNVSRTIRRRARSWQASPRIQKAQIQRFAFKFHSQVQLSAGACVGLAPACRLTLRSRGRPNGVAHWPSSAGACGPILRLLSNAPRRRAPP
jgi:hypothetical protein